MSLASLVVLSGVAFALSGAGSTTVSSILTVTNASDSVNGDVSSPAALRASPGADGISLREALTAANNGPGPWEITFAPRLAGRTISPLSALPPISRDGVMVDGLADASGSPTVTISGAQQGGDVTGGLLTVRASGVTVEHLRFVGILATGRAVEINAGAVNTLNGGSSAPQEVSNIRVDANVFDNTGEDGTAWALNVEMGDVSSNATLSSVQITGNRFVHWVGDGDDVLIGADGVNDTIQSVTVADNALSDTTYGVELTPSGPAANVVPNPPEPTNDKVIGTRIEGNTFSAMHNQDIVLGIGRGNDGNLIQDTLITGNTITGSDGFPIGINGGYQGASNNTISSTQIVNDVIANGNSLILIDGGTDGGSGNHVDGVTFVNDTIADYQNAGLALYPNERGSSGNDISGVTVTNTIISSGNAFQGDASPSSVQTSITSQVMSQIVDPGAGDFHLKSGSTAIDEGTSAGAPAIDRDGRGRTDGHPDIGAYEFGGSSLPTLTVSVTEVGGETGEITSVPAGIDCPALCSLGVAAGTSVTLTAIPWSGSRFAGWGGACSERSTTCTVSVSAASSVSATFSAVMATLKPPSRKTPKCKKGQKSTKKKPCRM